MYYNICIIYIRPYIPKTFIFVTIAKWIDKNLSIHLTLVNKRNIFSHCGEIQASSVFRSAVIGGTTDRKVVGSRLTGTVIASGQEWQTEQKALESQFFQGFAFNGSKGLIL